MIYTHKLLPVLFSPIILVILLCLLAAVSGRKKYALLAAVLLILASIPVSSDYYFRLVEDHAVRLTPATMPEADAIVVLGGMLDDVAASGGIVKEWSDSDRFFGGLELFRAGKAPQLIFTGALLPWQINQQLEGVALKRYAEDFGISATQIQVTRPVENTADEAVAVKQLLSAKNKVLLVTSAYHMPRAKQLFEEQGITVYAYPVDFKVSAERRTAMDFLPKGRSLWLTEIAMREFIGRAYYDLRRGLKK